MCVNDRVSSQGQVTGKKKCYPTTSCLGFNQLPPPPPLSLVHSKWLVILHAGISRAAYRMQNSPLLSLPNTLSLSFSSHTAANRNPASSLCPFLSCLWLYISISLYSSIATICFFFCASTRRMDHF